LLGIVGHDLRNPLSAILMAARVLESVEADGREHRLAARIRASGERMERIIRDLLDLTKVRLGGGIFLRPEATDAHALCSRMVEELQAGHPEREIRLVVEGSGAGCWDPDRLEQVVSNLVSNALQYGMPDVPVTVVSDGSGRDWMLSVHNHGEPIRPEVLPHIFDPFTRGLDAARASDRRGNLGLGLFIVDELVRGHGGTLSVTSARAEGTRFVASLPRAIPA
jgi:signal transduction histidine kinase